MKTEIMLRVANTTMVRLSVLLSLGACVSTNLDTPSDHPANPNAKTVPLASSQALLASASPDVPANPQQDESMPQHHHRSSVPVDGTAPTMQMQAPALHPSSGSGQANKPPAAEVWTCSMHPEISRPGPGKCPICGMNLVKREGAGH